MSGALSHSPGLTLLVACESFIGDDSVRDRSARRVVSRAHAARPGAWPSAVTALCADADLRPTRIGELMGMASAVLPELDQPARMISAGACCDTAGAVGPLAALALAHREAVENGGQVLCVSNADSHYRSALLVRRA